MQLVVPKKLLRRASQVSKASPSRLLRESRECEGQERRGEANASGAGHGRMVHDARLEGGRRVPTEFG